MSNPDSRPIAGSEPAAVELSGLSKRFDGLRAIDFLTLQIPRGEIFGIMGPNGAGKSTLINLLSGFLSPDSGRILLGGEDVTGLPAHRVAEAGIARTYQNVRLFHGLSVLETVSAGFHRNRSAGLWGSLMGTRSERKGVELKARELLEQVGVEVSPETSAMTLSYGDQRRVEIARALASGPSVLCLDEPTAGMNDAETDVIAALLHVVQQSGVTIILVEHNIGLVLDHCDQAAVLNFGQLLAVGSPRACIDDPLVREAYFGRQSDAQRVETLLRLRRDPGSQGS